MSVFSFLKLTQFSFMQLFFITIIMFGITSHVNAAAIGMPKSTLKYGLATHAGFYKIHDPNGETDNAFFVQPYHFIVSDWLPNGYKYWLEIYYSAIAFNATHNHMGQEIKQSGSKMSLLYEFNANKNWHPWLGAGLDLSYSKANKRHAIDSDGYLIQQFNDRNFLNAAVLMQAAAEWHFSSTWYSGLKAEYRLPVGKTVQSLTLSLYFLIR